MITGPIIAEIAALVGDSTRATMLSALLDGGAGGHHASNRQHPSREADRGGLALGGPQWAASLLKLLLGERISRLGLKLEGHKGWPAMDKLPPRDARPR